MPRCAVALRSHFQNNTVVAWHGRGMACVNQTRPHCVNKMGKTQSKPLAARHGRGTAWYVWISLYTIQEKQPLSCIKPRTLQATAPLSAEIKQKTAVQKIVPIYLVLGASDTGVLGRIYFNQRRKLKQVHTFLRKPTTALQLHVYTQAALHI
jgi:hypothetical protein